ncbi:FAD:protein FMN transferase [Mucilaginibacter sp. 21P]|uniref:FAD:protein FMN transferase n=1 Tax=Mucilaginibacter sp. 21P TaxID=2778902 RepID=UPI001C570706|nr:FAD:protein FMN transferase [Mucilaginibacter sp. 21P]QXV65998.1 FAD:protein FMN transferase [Mucilaginibacter sp. 21P]
MLALKNLAENTTIFSRSVRLMGTDFNFDLVTDNAVWALQRIESAVNEINRIEKLLSTFNEESSINLINRNAGIAPVKVDAETFKLIDRAIQISALTYGSFDIAYGIPASKEHEGTVVTKTRTLKKKISLTNYTNIELDQAKQTVFLKNTNMRISLSALARGYAADKAKVTLQMEDVSSGVINISGDLLTWGLQPDGSAWTIAAANSTKANEIYSHVEISNMAVVTSVNPDLVANRAVINAESGFPVSAIKSISIISPTAELSGAMTGPMFGMGINTGLYLVNKLNQIACIAVDDHERVYTSKHIKL